MLIAYMQENTSFSAQPILNPDSRYETGFYRNISYYEEAGLNPLHFILTPENGKNIFKYLKSFNLTMGLDLLILPQSEHFYYEESELKSIKTIVNLKKLNQINDLDSFFKTLKNALHPNTNFVGFFYETRSLLGSGLLSGFSTRIKYLFDFRIGYILERKDVETLLRKHGFTLIDFTEMNGLTYFYSKRIGQPMKISA
jgi:hypothetical protein